MRKINFSICIPIRIDSLERLQNLRAIIMYFLQLPDLEVIVLEADRCTRIPEDFKKIHRLRYYFIMDENPIFFRTKYINQMLNLVRTDIAAIFDADIVLSRSELLHGFFVHQKKNLVLSLPYDGRCFSVLPFHSDLFRQNLSIDLLKNLESRMSLMNGYKTVGGVYLVSVSKYKTVGMENEYFKGWGPEDSERVHRLQILGYEIQRMPNPIYHLYHPRLCNSDYYDDTYAIAGKMEYCKVCNMKKEELKRYIASWPWIMK